MTETNLTQLQPNRLFAIPLTDSEHRIWANNGTFSYLDYKWQDIPVSGNSSKEFIAIGVAQRYPDYAKEKIKNIADGIYQYSRLKKGDGILGFSEQNTIERVGYVSDELNLDFGHAYTKVNWFEDFKTISTRPGLLNAEVEIQKINNRLLKQLSLPNGFFRQAYRSTMSFGKELSNEILFEESIRDIEVKERSGGDIVLFYGTNRTKTGINNVNDFYGNELAELKLGCCTVSIPPGHTKGKVERPFKILGWQFNENKNDHIVLTSIREYSDAFFYNWLKEDLAKYNSRTALIFIHGYNNTFADAAFRAAQIVHDIPFNDGIAGFFSWPSSGKLLDYLGDIERADASIPKLEKFIEDLVNATGVQQLHLIAHSMGNRILTQAIKGLAFNLNFINKIKNINQIILAAPDIDTDVFDTILPVFKTIGNRRTLYANESDGALKKSKFIRGDRIRIGEAGERLYVADGLDTIDASNVDAKGNHHSYMFETKELLNDLYMILSENAAPDNRDLDKEIKNNLPYWLFRK